jgi:hypothetical protein
VWDHYVGSHCVANKKTVKLTEARRRRIRAVLKEYDEETACKAIDGSRYSPFHNGDNDEGQKHLGIEVVLRQTNIEKFVDYLERPESLPRKRRQANGAPDVEDALREVRREMAIERERTPQWS